ncbi:MAG: ParA family protein [Phycisphaerae bacterium]|nr:ParA family protein [Phycisphaerae bacterium]
MTRTGDWLIISVESRKGGVGKTTAALNLARLLLERHYAVLFLDVDITGTNAADAIDSPFWKNITHVICHADNDDRGRANLLQLFQDKFMAGKGTAECVSQAGVHGDALLIAVDRINVLGSQIYDMDGSRHDRPARVICKPSILFDELHAFWFIEFLQATCTAFRHAVANAPSDRPVAFVIDNSPGYVGIAPAVQEWLTDLGPHRGKFLTVTSLDRQDLASCGIAVHGLHALLDQKWKTSRKFLRASRDDGTNSPLNLEQDEQAFFLRLAETTESPHTSAGTARDPDTITGSDLTFYRGEADSQLQPPSRYQGLLINRVPRLVKQGTYQYDSDEVGGLLHRSRSDVVHSLLGDERGDYRQWMVSYDEYIEYQFIQSMISRRQGRRSRRQHFAEEIMERLMQRRPVPPDEPIQEVLHGAGEWTPSVLGQLRHYVHALHEVALDGIRILDQQGFSHLTRLIQDEWLPGNILQDFRNAMRDILLDTGFPYFEYAPWEDDTGPVNPEAMKMMNRLPHIITRHIEEAPVPLKLVRQFVPSLTAVVGLSLTSPIWHSPFVEEFGDLFGLIVSAEALHWTRLPDGMRPETSLQRFLAGDSLTKKDADKLHFKFRLHPRWHEQGSISHLYGACASAQARLLDLRQDTDFLVHIVRRLIQEEVREAPVLPYIRGVAESVIVKKTTSHEAGHREIAKGFSSAQYMDEFSAVLERILNRWGVNA